MATVFVAPVLPKAQEFALVMSPMDAGYTCVSVKDGVVLVAWTGTDITPALLETLPTEDILLGSDHERAIGIFTKMLKDVLEEAGLLCRLSGCNLMVHEVVVATREGVWRVDQAFGLHRGAYVCIGDGARTAETLYGEFINSYKDASAYSLEVRALHFARDFDTRTHGPYRCSIVTLFPQKVNAEV